MITKAVTFFSMAFWMFFMGAIIKGFLPWLETETGSLMYERPDVRVVK